MVYCKKNESNFSPSLSLLIDLTDSDVTKAQLGLGHSFSRSKCAQDVNRQDKPITYTIALI